MIWFLTQYLSGWVISKPQRISNTWGFWNHENAEFGQKHGFAKSSTNMSYFGHKIHVTNCHAENDNGYSAFSYTLMSLTAPFVSSLQNLFANGVFCSPGWNPGLLWSCPSDSWPRFTRKIALENQASSMLNKLLGDWYEIIAHRFQPTSLRGILGACRT